MNEVHEWHVLLTKLWVLDHGKVGHQIFESRQQMDQHFRYPLASCQDGTWEGGCPHILLSSYSADE